MDQSTQKKTWKTPELTILVRSKPEEAVLDACKNAAGGGPRTWDSGCMRDCVACDTPAGS